MNPTITTYVPVRDSKGKFSKIAWKKLAWKMIKYQLITLSLVTNLWFARHDYVITCAAGGHFITKQQCGDIAQAKQDSITLNTTPVFNQNLINNEDLFTK